MERLIIPIKNYKTKEEIISVNGTGSKTFISWDKITPVLQKMVGSYSGEAVTGLIIDQDGITLDLTTKRKLK